MRHRATSPPNVTAAAAAPAKPDADGFLRRWLLLEPTNRYAQFARSANGPMLKIAVARAIPP